MNAATRHPPSAPVAEGPPDQAGDTPPDAPHRVLFLCNLNAVRSPMAEAMLRRLHRGRIEVGSAGLIPGDPDPFTLAVMAEYGIDMEGQLPRSLAKVDPSTFDLVVALTPESYHVARDLVTLGKAPLERWDVGEPRPAGDTREAFMDAYREVRDLIAGLIRKRFPLRVKAG